MDSAMLQLRQHHRGKSSLLRPEALHRLRVIANPLQRLHSCAPCYPSRLGRYSQTFEMYLVHRQVRVQHIDVAVQRRKSSLRMRPPAGVGMNLAAEFCRIDRLACAELHLANHIAQAVHGAQHSIGAKRMRAVVADFGSNALCLRIVLRWGTSGTALLSATDLRIRLFGQAKKVLRLQKTFDAEETRLSGQKPRVPSPKACCVRAAEAAATSRDSRESSGQSHDDSVAFLQRSPQIQSDFAALLSDVSEMCPAWYSDTLLPVS
eukprot:scaffold214_cov249-Pinguiococcus_pyrenoidosus.AAC.33